MVSATISHVASLPCRIVLQGELSERFQPALEGLSVRHELGYTELNGTLADQAQLRSLLDRLFDLGMQIVSVHAGKRMRSDTIGPPSPGDDA